MSWRNYEENVWRSGRVPGIGGRCCLRCCVFLWPAGDPVPRVEPGIVAWLFGLFGEEPTPEVMGTVNYFLRRGAHLFLYFCIGLGLCGAFQWQKKVPAWLPAMALGVAFAVTDEYHQLFSGGRTGKPTDVLLDACGLALGCGASYLLSRCAEAPSALICVQEMSKAV